MAATAEDQRGLLEAVIRDGRPLIRLTAVLLFLFGLFAFFLSATRHWLLVVSGAVGFGSFLLYLGYGYLDTWHGMATLALLPCFVWGLIKTHSIIERAAPFSSLARGSEPIRWDSVYAVGRLLLLTTAFCLGLGGLIIAGVGATTVFVPQDLEFMGLSAVDLRAINPRLVPLIAHDRAGFGGGVCCCGVTMFFCLWCGSASRGLWQALLLTGLAGFGTAIGVHPAVGYMSFSHLFPACLGAVMFTAGMLMTFRRMWFASGTGAVERGP
jgi:hypothetical protein